VALAAAGRLAEPCLAAAVGHSAAFVLELAELCCHRHLAGKRLGEMAGVYAGVCRDGL